jgi:gluconolactonase
MARDGQAATVLEQVDGQPTTSANFAFHDRRGRRWLACLTREDHRWPAVAQPRPDGLVVLVDPAAPGSSPTASTPPTRPAGTPRALAVRRRDEEGAHPAVPGPRRRVAGRAGGVRPDGLGPGGLVDGFTVDAEGNLWVTTVVRNGFGVLTRDGDWHVVVEDPREGALAAFADKLAAGSAEPNDMLAAAGPRLQFPTSLCFAGEDRRTVYVGSLAMSRLPTFRSPVPGLPMSHWR